MRNLFLALVLANLAFAGWQYTRPEPRAAQREVGQGVSEIVLLSELEDAPGAAARAEAAAAPDAAARGGTEAAEEPLQAPEAAGSSASDAAAPGADEAEAAAADASAAGPARVCRSVGPFEELSQAAVAASTLREDGYEPSQRVAEGEIWVGHWVYLEIAEADADAEAILAELADAGMPEAYLITGSEADGDVISLGVFTEAARAERLADDVRALGYAPTITDRTRRGTVYWVDVEVAPGTSVDLERLQPSGRIVRLEQRPCP